MDNKNYNVGHAGEYRPSESGSESHFETGTESKASDSIFERINRRHILFGFLLVFMMYWAYQLLSKVFHVVEERQQALTKEVTAAKNKSHLTPSVPPQAPPREAPQNEVKKLTQGQATLQATLSSLTMQLSDIQSSLSNLNNQFAQMSDQVQTLQARQALLLKKATSAPVKQKVIKKEPPRPIYYVRAIIPGRVWLTTPSGTTLTLGLGDTLAGYGSVKSINPEQGLITLSSGATIGYSPDDR